MSGLKLLVSDNAGIYVPQRFFQDYNCVHCAEFEKKYGEEIQKLVEDPIAEMLLSSSVKEGNTIHVDSLDKKKLVFTTE